MKEPNEKPLDTHLSFSIQQTSTVDTLAFAKKIQDELATLLMALSASVKNTLVPHSVHHMMSLAGMLVGAPTTQLQIQAGAANTLTLVECVELIRESRVDPNEGSYAVERKLGSWPKPKAETNSEPESKPATETLEPVTGPDAVSSVIDFLSRRQAKNDAAEASSEISSPTGPVSA